MNSIDTFNGKVAFEIHKIVKNESEYDKTSKIVSNWHELVNKRIEEMEAISLKVPEKLRSSFTTIGISSSHIYMSKIGEFKKNIVVLRVNDIVEGMAIYHKIKLDDEYFQSENRDNEDYREYRNYKGYYKLDYLITHPVNLDTGIVDGEKNKRISGVGTALIKWLEEKCPKSGMKGIALSAEISSIGFYEKLGFKLGDKKKHVLKVC